MDGFLPFSRASFMLDVVTIAMFVILPVLGWSIYLVRYRRNYKLHKRIQLALGGLLLVTLVIFEVDIRLHGWRHLAEASPYYHTSLSPVLYVHLAASISTTLLWIYTISSAVYRLRGDNPPAKHRAAHRRIARIAAAGMGITAITGWTFYWMAFVA